MGNQNGKGCLHRNQITWIFESVLSVLWMCLCPSPSPEGLSVGPVWWDTGTFYGAFGKTPGKSSEQGVQM